MKEKYILNIGKGVWIADWEGDPPRTLVRESAKQFSSREKAKKHIEVVKQTHPFRKLNYKIEKIYKMKTTKITYSKDYDLLFDLVMDGNVIPAFVDYNFNKELICRDVCSVKTLEYSSDIDFGVRGMSYMQSPKERKEFKQRCESLNLEFITNIKIA